MRIVTAAQRSPEWYSAKAGVFSASCFGDLMATIKSGVAAGRRNLVARIAVERMTGVMVESYQNAAMLRGIELEEAARAAYEAHRGDLVMEAGFALHDTLDFAGASVDGLCGDDGLVELKCPDSMGKHMDALMHGLHATEYRWQIQGQLWIADRAWCDAVSYDPRWPTHLRLAIVRVPRDDVAIKALETECHKAEAEVQAIIRELQERKAA